MKINSEPHLDENQLIQAVVDKNDLPAPVRAHLAACGQCLASTQSFEQELASLGSMAERYAPKPQRSIRLPVHESKSSLAAFLTWRNAVGAVVTVAAVIIVFWGTTLVRNLTGSGTQGPTAEMIEAKQLMTEVNMLIDNPLPPLYLEISGEHQPDYDMEFFQFLIPQIETETLTSDRWKRGYSLC